MSKKTYSEWLKRAMRDPLWYVEIIATIAILVLIFTGYGYGYGYGTNIPFCVAWIVLGLTLIASAIRGRDPGRDKPQSAAGRAGNAVLGLIFAGGAILCLFK